MQVQIQTQATDNGIVLTPMKYRRTDRYVGTAILSNVTVKDGRATGELVGEYLETYPFTKAELPGPVMQRMKPLTESVRQARILYAAGSEFFYLP